MQPANRIRLRLRMRLQLLFRSRCPETPFVISDHPGYPEMVIDTTGAPVWTADHLPFGETVSETGTANDPLLRYPGQWAVPSAEELNLPTLYYNTYRWYRPQWGRYTQSDPLGGGSLFRYNDVPENLFGYAMANPLRFFDPFGLCSCSDDCPGGVWGYFGVGGMGALVLGGMLFRGTYTCADNGFSVPVKGVCFVVGPIAAAGVGVEGDLGFNRVHGCNQEDLLGSAHGAMGTIGPFSATGTEDGSTGGLGRSNGVGGAYIYCRTSLREGWLLNPFGGEHHFATVSLCSVDSIEEPLDLAGIWFSISGCSVSWGNMVEGGVT